MKHSERLFDHRRRYRCKCDFVAIFSARLVDRCRGEGKPRVGDAAPRGARLLAHAVAHVAQVAVLVVEQPRILSMNDDGCDGW